MFKVANQDDINTDGMETAEDYGDWLLRQNSVTYEEYCKNNTAADDLVKSFLCGD